MTDPKHEAEVDAAFEAMEGDFASDREDLERDEQEDDK